ncbi:hypothetical protein HYS28_00820 [Candidatus Uhrbacteria bacterium]|nr:hypothetical protein [Candidatus Uhrbacteria bacterium]
MEDAKKAFWASLRPMIGQVVGVGMFGLPFVFAQAGFGVGMVAFALSAVVCAVTVLMYADMAVLTKGHARFVGLIREHAGPVGAFFAAVGLFGGLYGAMTAYLIVGGSFAYQVFSPVLGGTVAFYRTLFFFLGALVVFGGMTTVARLQKYLIVAYVGLMALLAVLAAPHIDIDHYALAGDPEKFFLPFGVALFAFTGFGSVPEMRDALGRHKHLLRRSVLAGMAIIGLLYLVFVTAVVGVTGKATSVETIHGLADVLGPAFVLIAAAIGMCTVMTAFVTHALVMTNTYAFDYRLRYLVAWALTLFVPPVLVMVGADDFIGVIDFTGGVFIGITGLVLIATYETLRRKPQTAKRSLFVPRWAVLSAGLVFIANIVLALFG